MNNTYKITVGSPLLRPGITIETEISERYVVPALEKLMEQIREFNSPQEEQQMLVERVTSDNPPIV